MALRVAPCPRCRGAVVFGERSCRSCQQPFDYGGVQAPVPTPEQVREALAAASAPNAASAAPPSSPPEALPLESGRFEAPGRVEVQDVPGFVESSLFRAFTQEPVDAPRLTEIEDTRARPVTVEVQPLDVERVALVTNGGGMPVTDGTSLTDLEPSTRGARPSAARSLRAALADLPLRTCRCGETHRLPRCPACGAAPREEA